MPSETTQEEEIMTRVIDKDELSYGGIARKFEGDLHGGTNVSFFLVDAPPGSGPGLHVHPYEEVFVVQEGNARFTVGDATIEATGGQIVIVPAGVAHKFVSSGDGPLRQVAIHLSGRMTTEWLAD
jgi:mannose-6-phosphate isomerase-like protein (cupin superfamily)